MHEEQKQTDTGAVASTDAELNSEAAYNKQYYESNRERINERRRNLYKNNETIRDYYKDKRRAYREVEKAQRQKRREALQHAPFGKPGKEILVPMPDGSNKRIAVFTIGQFAHRLGIGQSTVRSIERAANLPKPPQTLECGARRYTADEISVWSACIARNRQGAKRFCTPDFYSQLRAALSMLHAGVTYTPQETNE